MPIMLPKRLDSSVKLACIDVLSRDSTLIAQKDNEERTGKWIYCGLEKAPG
jgi:hypothetical protein